MFLTQVLPQDVEAWVDTFFYVMDYNFSFMGFTFNLMDCVYGGIGISMIGLVIAKIFMPYMRGVR